MSKCKRVRFRIINKNGIDAFACRMNNGKLMYMSINPKTLVENGRFDQNCTQDYKNFEDFQAHRKNHSVWNELKKP